MIIYYVHEMASKAGRCDSFSFSFYLKNRGNFAMDVNKPVISYVDTVHTSTSSLGCYSVHDGDY